MGFSLYKGNPEVLRCLAGGAIVKGQVLKLDTQSASTSDLRPKVVAITGGSDSATTDTIFGIAMETVADTAEVLAMAVLPDMLFVADTAAAFNRSSIGAVNYLVATGSSAGQELTVGAVTNAGQKCRILGAMGASGDKKAIVSFLSTVIGGPGAASLF